ncbi:hypothetical protein AVEN_149614-1 [Araneus ventricosus]|uniref:Uncharacterized protein n=1 Tax=Araneus ventricosus TaxID=182803 RepID=A0A4Y2L0K2_ARAVE|nr:hypothetical protein AVEN_149614-1 [Araneus ventricosus]
MLIKDHFRAFIIVVPTVSYHNLIKKRLQDPQINFSEAFNDLNSLVTEIAEIRADVCQNAIQKAKLICDKWGIDIQTRIRKRRKMLGELARDAGLAAEEESERIMKSVLYAIQQEIKSRFTRLNDLDSKFGFCRM